MPRSASDATRFTATGPNASSGPFGGGDGFSANTPSNPRSTPQGTRINPSATAAPRNETSQQKIARLRAAAAANKRGSEPPFDRVVRVGRRWADRAHRVTALSLVGLTLVTGCVATAGITDMLLHNRRRRNEWFAEQKAKHAKALVEAREAIGGGWADEDQVLLVNREVAAQKAEEEKRNRPGVFKRIFGGKEGESGQKEGAVGSETVVGKVEEMLGAREDKGVLQAVEEKVESGRRGMERVEQAFKPLGGPLDREADAAVRQVQSVGKSWTQWITGG